MRVISKAFLICAMLCVLSVLLFTTTASATPVVSRDINSYALFAYNQLVWKGANDSHPYGNIVGGNIGVNYAGLSPTGWSLSFGANGPARMSDGTQAVADSVTTDGTNCSFFDLFANSWNTSANPTIRDAGPLAFSAPIISVLPTLPFTPNRALTNNASDLTVAKNLSYTMVAGAYRDVSFNDGDVITFGNGVYDLRNVNVGKNVKINVMDGTVFQIDDGFTSNTGLLLGTNVGYNGGAHMYVGGYGIDPTSTRGTTFSTGGEIHLQYFGPNTWLDLGGTDQLFGRYWAQRITGDFDINVTYQVPEPATMCLLGLGALSLLKKRRA